MRFKFFQQLDRMDCGPCCLQMILYHFTKYKFKISYLREVCDVGKDGCSLYSINKGAKLFGLTGDGYQTNIDSLYVNQLFPSILYWENNHFVILIKITCKDNGKKSFHIADPYKGKYNLNESEFLRLWCSNGDSGYVLHFNHFKFSEKSIKYLDNDKDYFFISSLKKYYISYIVILFGLFLSLLLQAIFPFLSKALFDFGIDDGSYNFVLFIILSQIIFHVIRLCVQYFRDFIALKTGTKISIDLVTKYLTKLVYFKYKYFDTKNSGDIIQSISDNSRIENFLTNELVSFLLSLTNLIVFQFILFYFDWRLFLVLNFFICIYVLASKSILFKFKRIDYLRFETMSKNQSFIYQMINGILDIKLNNGISKKIEEWTGLRSDLYEITKESIKLHQYRRFLNLCIMNFTSLIIVGYTAFQVIDGVMTVGEFIAIQYIIAQLSLPIDGIIEFKLAYDLAKVSSSRFKETSDFPTENDINSKKCLEINTDIVFQNVSFSYSGNKDNFILKDINATIKNGKINAIVGPSGSGKSTFIKLLLKLYSPTVGSIFVNGDNLDSISYDSWRERSGSVLQEGFIFSESILNNIVIGGGEIDNDKLENAIRISNLKDVIGKLPRAINSTVGLDGVGLSGGQKQRILIARAIFKHPDILIFDEATNSLDSINEDLIYDNLEEFYKDRTVIIIAHRLSTIKNADHILVFDEGSVVETGTHSELLSNNGLYFNLSKKQEIV
ncbi:peptidase domain-containing ABC transporter [Litoribacter populi]|uniref:peptidase domain-containing ABC transporter n=1 Tax=Litoribacter populi TaxID=2598460 RepID=UPI00117C18A8|nr:peptidase domain-containing ABC transporter [Litoribacter populi]